MKKKDLILKWLDHEPLSESESKAFEQLNADDSFTKISDTAKQFGAPPFDVDQNLMEVLAELKSKEKELPEKNKTYKFSWIIRIAAVLVIGIGVFLAFFLSTTTEINTLASEKTTITLPDQSTVMINAASSVQYNGKNWDTKRQIDLQGEAFFKVAKGKRFDVRTSSGVISVLGTQFNVEVRENYFEVSCFEGSVMVTRNAEETKLGAGDVLKVMDNVLTTTRTNFIAPDWTQNKSTFKSTPLHYVFKELERQYNIKIITKNVDQNTLFTGNFVHSDLKTAIQSITIPTRLKYLIDNNLITLYKE